MRPKVIAFEAMHPMCRLMATAGVIGLVAGLGTALQPTSAHSETAGFVTLEALNGNASIGGELVEFTGDAYLVRSTVGMMRIDAKAVRCVGAACPEIPVETAEAPRSRQVVLKAIEDGSEIQGELVGFDGKAYVINTVLGEFRVAKSIVRCQGAACPEIESYAPQFAVYSSDSATHDLMADLWRGFADETGHRYEVKDGVVRLSDAQETLVAEITLKSGDFEGAPSALSSGDIEVALIDGEIDPGKARAAGLDLGDTQQSTLGYDGLVVVANPSLPVRSIATDEMRRIWNGQLRTWRPLGGGDFPITFHAVESRIAAAPRPLIQLASTRGSLPEGVVYHETEEDVIAAVQADRNAIGIVHRVAAVKAHAKMMEIRKVCGLTVAPSDFDIQIDHYPMKKPVRAYGKGVGIHPIAASFLEWSQTDAVQPHVTQAGFTDAGLKRMKIQDMGMQLIHTAAVEPDFDGSEFASMMRELRFADRLSITFRFLPGSSTLDEKSAQSIRDLADRLRGREFDGQELLLVGFADSVGPANRNTVLAAQRAEAVRAVIEAEFDPAAGSKIGLRTMSFGEQMPVDCNDTDAGRANNRRVEVWARVARGI